MQLLRSIVFSSLSLSTCVAIPAEPDAGSLGYFVGYYAAVVDTQNGVSFCIPESTEKTWAAALRPLANTPPTNPASIGVIKALSEGFPCGSAVFVSKPFSMEASIGMLELTDAISPEMAGSPDFSMAYMVSTFKAVMDMHSGKDFCFPDSGGPKLSEALSMYSKKHPNSAVSGKSLLTALKDAYPCQR